MQLLNHGYDNSFESWGALNSYLVEVEGTDVNLRDRWDSVPLYYCCLAGAFC